MDEQLHMIVGRVCDILMLRRIGELGAINMCATSSHARVFVHARDRGAGSMCRLYAATTQLSGACGVFHDDSKHLRAGGCLAWLVADCCENCIS